MSRPTILIAGATGTNGRALIEALRPRGVAIRALARDPETARTRIGSDIDVVTGDLADPSSLDAAMDGVDRAYVVTAIQPDTLTLFDNFFAAAKRAGVGHVVKFSGLGAAAGEGIEILRQHGVSDDRLRESGLTYTILRPNSFHQNMLGQAAAIATAGRFHLPLGDARQSTIDVRDIAEITATVLTTRGHDGRAYDLTGPEALDFHEVAAVLAEARGAPVAYVPVDAATAEAAMREAGMPDWTARAIAELQRHFATGAAEVVTPDAERLLGRPPRRFRDFALDHAAAFAPNSAT